MSLLTTIAASVLMSPANVATNVPPIQQEAAAYDWKTQKVMSSDQTPRINPTTHFSLSGTTSQITLGGGMVVDDVNQID